jgi:hypothetical protein
MFQTTNQKISLLDALSIISRDISIQWIGQGKIQPFFRRRFFPNPSAAQFVLRKRTSPSWPATVAPSWENSNVEAESLHHISMGIQYGILDIYVYLYIRSMGISMYVYISYIYTQTLHVWYIYLQNWVMFGVNVDQCSIHVASRILHVCIYSIISMGISGS